MIAVSGPSGAVGRHLVAHLAGVGAPVRAIARNPGRVDRHDGRVEVVTADLDRPASLEAALRGVSRLFLLSPGPDVPAQDAAQIDAAVRAGVRHVVMLSSLGVDLGGIAGGKPHMAGEATLRASGLDWTLLRPSEFMSNALRWGGGVRAAGALFVPSGEGRIGFIDPDDIARVAARALTEPGHEGRIHRLTGPAALTLAEVAQRIGAAIGREIRHVDVSDVEFRRGAAEAGMPGPLIELLSDYYAAVREDRVAMVTGEVESLTGSPPRDFAAWAQVHADAFR